VAELIALEDALRAVLDRASRLPEERVPIERASGRVLASAASALVDLPPFPSSAMDGYAVRSVDTPGRLPVVFRIAAGSPSPRPLGAGEAMGIATGGVVPEGADAVIPHEEVVSSDNGIEIRSAVAAGANVRPRGGDVAAGRVVIEAGVRLGPAQLGALAAAGVAEIACVRRPRAAVLTTGSELRAPGATLEPGEVYEANGIMLEAQLTEAGADVASLGAVPDDEDAHRAALERGLEADVLVSSGGVSVGPHDLVRRIASELGVEEIFWGVSVKPGKPVAFGVRGDTLVFGLPGNPVSSLVACRLLVVPAVNALEGVSEPGPEYEVGVLARPLRPDPRRVELVRARTSVSESGLVLDPLEGRESHMIAQAAEADALVLVPPGEQELPAGSTARYLRV
jgi:molybdopterin molybdotransferase